MRKIRFLIPILVISVFLVSCASAPPEDDPKVEDTVVVEKAKPAEKTPVDKTAMNAAKSQAETARKRAMDAKAPRAAKGLFTAAATQFDEGVKSEENEKIAAAISSYTLAAEGFEAAADAADQARVEALEAMRAADEAIESTEKSAEEALREVSGENA